MCRKEAIHDTIFNPSGPMVEDESCHLSTFEYLSTLLLLCNITAVSYSHSTCTFYNDNNYVYIILANT